MAEPQRESEDVANFSYSNSSHRPHSRFIVLAGRVVPGVARVQADVPRFAEQWERANRTALARTGPLWIALGDSLTQGIGAPTYDRGWVGQLHERITGEVHDLRVVNLAVSGARTQDVLDRQLPVLAALAATEPLPVFVTLMIGSNDIINRRHRAGLPRRFERVLRQLPSGSVVTTLPNPSAAAEQVNSVIAHVAAERGLVVAELRGPRTSSWRGKLAADHFHPNERGYAAITDEIAQTVLPIFRAGSSPVRARVSASLTHRRAQRSPHAGPQAAAPGVHLECP